MSRDGLFRSDPFTASGKSLDWLVVTRVCKHWRETALHYPQLWSYIHSGFNTPWLKLMLSRAKSVPLSIELNSDALAAHGPEVSKHVSCIRDLSLTADTMDEASWDSWEPIFQSMVTSSARSLQRLTFRYGEYSHMLLSKDIFQSHAPLLRSIDLYHAYIPWSAPIVCNLTHLNVTLFEGHWPRTSSDELLDALRRMPALETLNLAYCLPSRGDDSIVHLPYLRCLDLEDEITRCSYLSKCLCIPSCCCLSLVCTTGVPTSDIDEERYQRSEQMKLQSITEVIFLFYVHVNREQAPLQSLYACIEDNFFSFSLSRTGKDEGSIMHRLRLPHSWRNSTESIWDVEIAALCSGLHMEGIRHINCILYRDDADAPLSPSPYQLLGVLRRVPALETLELSRCLRRGTRDFADYDIVNHGTVELPCLKTLNLRSVEIDVCSELIKCLRLPSSCSLDLDGNSSSAHGHIEAISVFCAHANREAGQTHLQSLKMLIKSYQISIETSRPAADGKMERSYSLQFRPPHDIDSLWSPVAALCHGLPIEHIRHLELERPESFWRHSWTPAPKNWLDVLGRCRAVEEVQFTSSHEEVLVFCTALTIPVDKKGTPFLQNVRRLALEGIEFTQDDSDKAHKFYAGLRNQMQARLRSKPIHTVCIQVKWTQENKEERFKSSIKDLKRFVPEIEWTKSNGTKKMWKMDDRDEDDSDYDDRYYP